MSSKMLGGFQIKFIIIIIVIAGSKKLQVFGRLLKNSHAIGKIEEEGKQSTG